MPPCLYICCHFEISNEHNGSPSRPRATSKTLQDGRRTSRRHSSNRERPRERLRVDRQRHLSHHRSQSASVSIPRRYQLVPRVKTNFAISENPQLPSTDNPTLHLPTTPKPRPDNPEPCLSRPKHPTASSPQTHLQATPAATRNEREPAKPYHITKTSKTKLHCQMAAGTDINEYVVVFRFEDKE